MSRKSGQRTTMQCKICIETWSRMFDARELLLQSGDLFYLAHECQRYVAFERTASAFSGVRGR